MCIETVSQGTTYVTSTPGSKLDLGFVNLAAYKASVFDALVPGTSLNTTYQSNLILMV